MRLGKMLPNQHSYVANFQCYTFAKYFNVWSTFGQVIVKINGVPFYGS